MELLKSILIAPSRWPRENSRGVRTSRITTALDWVRRDRAWTGSTWRNTAERLGEVGEREGVAVEADSEDSEDGLHAARRELATTAARAGRVGSRKERPWNQNMGQSIGRERPATIPFTIVNGMARGGWV